MSGQQYKHFLTAICTIVFVNILNFYSAYAISEFLRCSGCQGNSAGESEPGSCTYTPINNDYVNYGWLVTECTYGQQGEAKNRFFCDKEHQTWCDTSAGCTLSCTELEDPNCGCAGGWKCECPEGITPGITVGEPCTVTSHITNNLSVTGYKSDADQCHPKCDYFQYSPDEQCCIPKQVKIMSQDETLGDRYTISPTLGRSIKYNETSCPTQPLEVSCKYPYYHAADVTPTCTAPGADETAQLYVDNCTGCDNKCEEDDYTTTHICKQTALGRLVVNNLNTHGYNYAFSTNNCGINPKPVASDIEGSFEKNPERFQRTGRKKWKNGLCEFVYEGSLGCAPGYKPQGNNNTITCMPCKTAQYADIDPDSNITICSECPTGFKTTGTTDRSVPIFKTSCYIDSNTMIIKDKLGEVNLSTEIGKDVKLYYQGN